MPHTACHLALLAMLTLTLLVASANGFNLLRETRHLSPMESSGIVKRSTETPRFVILLDGGSSGIKVNVFELHFEANTGGLPSDFTELTTGTIKVKPGLHILADNSTAELKNYLGGVFNELKSAGVYIQLPQSQTVLYLLATAGMRELQKSDKNKANTLMDNVASIFSDSGFNPFIFKKAEIMSGRKEGVYAWLAANFLNNFFNTDMNRDDSVGLMEMGGSSLQLAYMPLERSEEGCDVVVNSGQPTELHVHSYVRFGSHAISQQIMDGLCDTNEVKNPCMLRGDSADLTCNGEQTVSVSGTGDPETCRGRLREIVKKSVCKAAAKGMLFYAVDSFRFALNSLKAVHNDVLNITTLEKEADVYCKKTWEEVKEMRGSEDYISSDCTVGLFILELLERMDLVDNTIKVTQTINEKSISWALGAAMDILTDDISVTCGITK